MGKSFIKDKAVIQDVSFTVGHCEAVALIGSNGAGKSTALRCCMRLIEPDKGSIELFGEQMGTASARRLRRIRADVGFIFQRHNLVPRLSALSNVIHGELGRASGPRYWLQAFAPMPVRTKAMQLLDNVGLSHIAAHRADQLSGGQSQRVAIARAMMQSPKMIVADEPVASLDPVASEEVMEIFIQQIKHNNITLLFTSHNVDHALRYADRVIALKDGRIALDAPAKTLSASVLREQYDKSFQH